MCELDICNAHIIIMLDKICDRLLRNHQWYDLYEDNYLSDKLDQSHLRSWALWV